MSRWQRDWVKGLGGQLLRTAMVQGCEYFTTRQVSLFTFNTQTILQLRFMVQSEQLMPCQRVFDQFQMGIVYFLALNTEDADFFNKWLAIEAECKSANRFLVFKHFGLEVQLTTERNSLPKQSQVVVYSNLQAGVLAQLKQIKGVKLQVVQNKHQLESVLQRIYLKLNDVSRLFQAEQEQNQYLALDSQVPATKTSSLRDKLSQRKELLKRLRVLNQQIEEEKSNLSNSQQLGAYLYKSGLKRGVRQVEPESNSSFDLVRQRQLRRQRSLEGIYKIKIRKQIRQAFLQRNLIRKDEVRDGAGQLAKNKGSRRNQSWKRDEPDTEKDLKSLQQIDQEMQAIRRRLLALQKEYRWRQ